jgi:hypothetical protein
MAQIEQYIQESQQQYMSNISEKIDGLLPAQN